MKKLIIALAAMFLLSGCVTVTLVDQEQSTQAKQFNPPADGKAGVYLYRDSSYGAGLKRSLFINGYCVGESAPYTFFYKEVEGDRLTSVETESEFSNNSVVIFFEKGKQYFIRQYIKVGLIVGGTGLEQVDNEEAKAAIKSLDMAKTGNCGGE